MNEFRILKEQTFNYKNDKLWLMLLREDGRFGVEVVNRKKSFGRKYAKDRSQADFMFDKAMERLSRYSSLTDAEYAVKRCFSLKCVDKFLFVLIFDGKVSSQVDIVKLKVNQLVNFRTRVKINWLKGRKMTNALSVYVYAGSDKKAFGVLTGTREAKKLTLELLK